MTFVRVLVSILLDTKIDLIVDPQKTKLRNDQSRFHYLWVKDHYRGIKWLPLQNSRLKLKIQQTAYLYLEPKFGKAFVFLDSKKKVFREKKNLHRNSTNK